MAVDFFEDGGGYDTPPAPIETGGGGVASITSTSLDVMTGSTSVAVNLMADTVSTLGAVASKANTADVAAKDGTQDSAISANAMGITANAQAIEALTNDVAAEISTIVTTQKNRRPLDTLYVSSNPVFASLDETGSFTFPFHSLANACGYAKANSIRNCVFSMYKGDEFEEDLVLDWVPNWSFFSTGDDINIGAVLQSIQFNGDISEFSMQGVDITDNLTLNPTTGTGQVHIHDAAISGNIVINIPDGATNYVIKFTGCTFGKDSIVTMNGDDNEGLVLFDNCSWITEAEDQDIWDACVINNNPGCQMLFKNCMDLPAYNKQGNMGFSAGCFLVPSTQADEDFAFVSESDGGSIAFGDSNTVSWKDGNLLPIKLTGNSMIELNHLEFKGAGSILMGEYLESGAGSTQLRDNSTRAGYTPIIRDTGGAAVPRTKANTIKDHLNGISDALARLEAIDPQDQFLTTDSAVVDPDTGLVTGGGWKCDIRNLSTSDAIVIKDKNGNDFLNFDVRGLITQASSGIDAVVGMQFGDKYWDPSQVATYTVGQIVNYIDRGYEVIATMTASDTTSPLTDTTHYKFMDNWGVTVGRSIKAYEDFLVFAEGRVWLSKQATTLTQTMVTAFSTKDDGDTFTSDGVTFISMQPAMPTTTPGSYLMFVLTNGTVSFANMQEFVVTGSTSISVSNRVLTVLLNPTSGLVTTPTGLAFGAGYQAYPDADKNKLAALPANVALTSLLNGKVDVQQGKGLSSNDYTSGEQAKLNAYPAYTDVDARMTANNQASAANAQAISSLSTSTSQSLSDLATNKQDKLTLTGASNVMLAPTAVGGQPSGAALTTFARTTTASKPNGARLMYDASGNVVSAGVAITGLFTTWASIVTYAQSLPAVYPVIGIAFDFSDATNLPMSSRCIGSMLISRCLPSNTSHLNLLCQINYNGSAYLSPPRLFVRNSNGADAWSAWVGLVTQGTRV